MSSSNDSIHLGSPGGHEPHRVDGGDGLVEEQCLLDVLQGEEEVHVKVYKRRWYILLVFSLVAVLQGITTCH